MARLFISQERINQLAADDRVVVDGDRMQIPALGASFRIEPAVYFLRAVAEEGDLHELVGRVKTVAQLEEYAADIVADSVVIGETAYDIENGFVGDVLTTGGAAWMGQLKQMPDQIPE